MKLFVIIITILLLASCRQEHVALQRISASQTRIDSTLAPDDSLQAFILPYRRHVEEVLNTPLAYAPRTLSKTDGRLNSSIGNLMADLVLQETDSLMRLQGQPPVDLVLLNHGGIRSVISQGPVTERTAYEVMPFENTIYIIPMSGRSIRELVSFLLADGKPHPIAGISIRLDAEGSLKSVDIGGKPFEEQRTYQVATSSYLAGGGDGMTFFADAGPGRDTGYRIRNAMVDYFRKVDTLQAAVDDRFAQETPDS